MTFDQSGSHTGSLIAQGDAGRIESGPGLLRANGLFGTTKGPRHVIGQGVHETVVKKVTCGQEEGKHIFQKSGQNEELEIQNRTDGLWTRRKGVDLSPQKC